MLDNITIASYRPKGQGVEGYKATKTGAVSANCCQYHVPRRVAVEQ